ncbi:hypothetical protein D5125_17125 [Magnetovirga frankeli]|uniref:hypothetical protein n=1 Tax=Magnetovirga frankeli TaxID=947516 RepID=UPI0012932F99|nr:hypothetical protein D5125_17125 [gamma proteobacterium SS-5]
MNTQGGSEFSRKGCEWLGCSSSVLHQWESVGRRANELSATAESLPASKRAISDLASLDDIAFRKALPKVQPDMTQKQVRELIKEISTAIVKSNQNKICNRQNLSADLSLPDNWHRGTTP